MPQYSSWFTCIISFPLPKPLPPLSTINRNAFSQLCSAQMDVHTHLLSDCQQVWGKKPNASHSPRCQYAFTYLSTAETLSLSSFQMLYIQHESKYKSKDTPEGTDNAPLAPVAKSLQTGDQQSSHVCVKPLGNRHMYRHLLYCMCSQQNRPVSVLANSWLANRHAATSAFIHGHLPNVLCLASLAFCVHQLLKYIYLFECLNVFTSLMLTVCLLCDAEQVAYSGDLKLKG